MTTTTSLGAWANHQGALTVEATVIDFLGEVAGDFDVEAIAEEYRDEINDVLPEGVWLHGNDFYGPTGQDRGELDIPALIAEVDLGSIARSHDLVAAVAEATERKAHSRAAADADHQRWQDTIRRALKRRVPADRLAKTAGVHVQRIYQIRHHRY